MRPLALALTTILALLASAAGRAQSYPDPRVDELLTRGADAMMRHDYAAAERAYSALRSEYPILPFGDCLLASLELRRAEDADVAVDRGAVGRLLANALLAVDKLVDEGERDPWRLYAAGLVNGYAAYHAATSGEWLDAADYGAETLDYFERCLERDPNNREAQVAVGVYDYWISAKVGSWSPFAEDRTDEALRRLERAVSKTRYHAFVALNALVWIYIDEGNPRKAVRFADTWLARYPGNRDLLWAKARALEDYDRRAANEIYDLVASSFLETEGAIPPTVRVTLAHKKAMNLAELGEPHAATKLLDDVLLARDIPDQALRRKADRLERMRELREELND
jgi:tetratricopeptide (TPR) repeat protein